VSKNNNATYKESRELREKDPNANTKICFEVRATALCPCLHIKGFQLSNKDLSQKDLHRGITIIQTMSTQLQLSHLYTRG